MASSMDLDPKVNNCVDFNTNTDVNNHLALTQVPLEVLLQVTSNLTTPELGNLRLSCKSLENALYPSFCKEFFSKRQFMISEFSLQALVDISESRLASNLKQIIIGTERPIPPLLTPFSHYSNNPGSILKSNAHIHEYYNHLVFINTSTDIKLLTKAFSNLQNLEIVGIRDFYSRTRKRDWPKTEWRSYGVNTYETNTNGRLELNTRFHMHGHTEWLGRLLSNLLCALGDSHRYPPNLEVMLRKIGIEDLAFNIPKFLEPTIQPVLSRLRVVFLDIGYSFGATTIVEDNNRPLECRHYLLIQFISRLEQLEYLRLNFRSRDADANSVMKWLAKKVPDTVSTSNDNGESPQSTHQDGILEFPPPIAMPYLRNLEFGMITVEARTILSVLRKFSTSLQAISLHRVNLLVPPPDPLAETRVNHWANLFSDLSKLNLNLTSIKMSNLSQQRKGRIHIHRRDVHFKDCVNLRERSWSGTNSQSGLRDLTAAVYVVGPEAETESESFTDMSEVSMSDEDEELDHDDQDDGDGDDGNDGGN